MDNGEDVIRLSKDLVNPTNLAIFAGLLLLLHLFVFGFWFYQYSTGDDKPTMQLQKERQD